MICTVSRSHEEATKDPEWPGPPTKKLKQSTLVLVLKDSPGDKKVGRVSEAKAKRRESARARVTELD